MKQDKEKFEKFQTSPAFRKQVIRKLEKSGTIKRMTPKEFASLVGGNNNRKQGLKRKFKIE